MKRLLLSAVFLYICAGIHADEGMWTFDHVPRAEIAKRYGVQITDQWLNRLQRSVVRLETGCTASFVSPDGLVLTNHHCISTCLADNSTAERDLVANGHIAERREDEMRCQGAQASVLVSTENLTDRVTKAIAGIPAAEVATARNKVVTTLESECEEAATKSGSPLACETVTLYQGGQYWLYKYKRYDDVRLAFAPEHAIAAFGGDPDNFQFPRWCLDMALLRVYENGKPASTPTHLTFDWDGAEDKEPVFVAGHPGTTERLLTVEQLKTQRNVVLPFWLLRFSELRGRLAQYSKTSDEAERTALDYLGAIENAHKVRRMQLFALLDDRMMEQKIEAERKLRERVAADPALKAAGGDPFDIIARAEQRYREILIPYTWLEGGAGFNSDLFSYARQLVRAAEERTKPNASRLREYTDSSLAQLRPALEAKTPVYPDLEKVRLSYSLERMREYLGPDHPVIKAVLGTRSPDQRAEELVSGSTLADPAVRMKLFEGGYAAITASKDPMILLAREVDQEARRLRRIYQEEVEGPERVAQQQIAEARFRIYGTDIYPDATFTLRLSYGTVSGWNEAGTRVEPFTRLGRMYERATGAPPFELPKRWLEAGQRLDMNTRANFVTTNDIIGGNSGSPVVGAHGRIVGLVFDGNIHSIAGSYWFDPEMNRTVAVHPQFIRAALGQVYPAGALGKELRVQ
ncbi:MAG TPA: S46 family peptidase [Vicinamibacterales bacterium]|nr:S46 family peptidase [Vicinamibacterales bacterium]